MGKWIEMGGTLLALAGDLHLQTGGDGPTFVQKLDAWVHSEDGRKVLGDIDTLLAEAGIPLVIAIRGK